MEYMGTKGLFTGLFDRNDKPIQIGDTLEFDLREWGDENNTFVVLFEGGELTGFGTVNDWSEWCVIVKKWNDK